MGHDVDAHILREALDAFEDSVAVYGPAGQHIYSSRAARRHYASFYEALDRGADHWDAVAQSVRKRMPHLPPDKVDAYVAFNKAKYESGETYSLVTDDGRNVLVTYRPLTGGLKAGISVDITRLVQRENELERARAEAEAASAAKSAFLSNMSHEIRTPLNGVLGLAQSLGHDGLAPEQRVKVEMILESGRQLLSVVNDVLELTNIASGLAAINPVEIDLEATLRAAVEMHRPRAEEKGLQLGFMFQGDHPRRVLIEPLRLRQCVNNLVANAIKFTETGRVIVACHLVGDQAAMQLEIEVVDTGIGISEKQMRRLFIDFSQMDDSATRRFGGAGLGLAIARRLACAMGGDLTVKSRLGHGSIFRLVLPTRPADANQIERRRTAPGRQKLNGARVLLVDDNPINRRVARLFLAPCGMVVTEAADGAQALEELTTQAFDIVLLDAYMPVLSGIEVVRRIRASKEIWSGIPIVMLTADAMSGDRERYLSMGADGYLPKPIDQRELLSVMAAAMQQGWERMAA